PVQVRTVCCPRRLSDEECALQPTHRVEKGDRLWACSVQDLLCSGGAMLSLSSERSQRNEDGNLLFIQRSAASGLAGGCAARAHGSDGRTRPAGRCGLGI